jgi:hypothetical protein
MRHRPSACGSPPAWTGRRSALAAPRSAARQDGSSGSPSCAGTTKPARSVPCRAESLSCWAWTRRTFGNRAWDTDSGTAHRIAGPVSRTLPRWSRAAPFLAGTEGCP